MILMASPHLAASASDSVAGLLQGGGGDGSASAPASPGDVIQMDAQISTHCGVPYTASLLAFDSVQRLLAVATL